ALSDGGGGGERAPHADDRPLNMRVRDTAAIGDDGLPQRRAIDFAARQKPWVRVDRRGGVEETVLRQEIRQIEVGFVKSADRSDVLPISVKNESADISLLDRLRDDVLSKIDQIVLQALYQHVPTKNVNA